MTYPKHKLSLRTGLAIILAISPTLVVLPSAEAANDLSASEIFKRAQDKYASLTSYSDNGSSIAEVGGMKLKTTFSIKLAQPGLYLVKWEQLVHPGYTNIGAVWSAGNGDFLKMGSTLQKLASKETALASATGVSGSAAATIPGTFFRMNWGNQLTGSELSSSKQSNEKVGEVDCYVFTRESKGQTQTLYIGQQDFLIHQVRTVTSDEAMKAVLNEAAKRHPEMTAPPGTAGPHGIISTETHENIVVNQKFSSKDFLAEAAEK